MTGVDVGMGSTVRGGISVWSVVKGVVYVVFFFKQKTAYEMLRSLVGSEMCIRDRAEVAMDNSYQQDTDPSIYAYFKLADSDELLLAWTCLLYTSDAADDLLCVDLGGRRIIKKKKYLYYQQHSSYLLLYLHTC